MIEHPEKVALVDMDGTLVDYAGQMRRDLELMASPGDPPWKDFEEETPRYIKHRTDRIKQTPGWWFNLPDCQLGHDVMNSAREIGFDIHVLTKGPYKTTSAWTEKVEWCRKHLSKDVKVTITEDKGLFYGRVLVDDYPDYMLRWLKWRPRGIGIMPKHHYNADFHHERVILYDGTNLGEVAMALQKAYERDSGPV
jgi:hypothetical protein